jgi:hypothetical protein
VIDVTPSATFPPGVPPAWDPPVPRRPHLWPTVVALAITALVLAGCFYVLISGLRVRYAERADACAALDITPVARLVGKAPLKTFPQANDLDCLGAAGDSPQEPQAIVRMTLSYQGSEVEALVAYEANADADAPGQVDLPGGQHGRLATTPLPESKGCVIKAMLQDVNMTMTAQLTLGDRGGDSALDSCNPRGPAAQALAATMRQSLSRLA